jgi:uncharacterized protein YndB with AHSA1/START domain
VYNERLPESLDGRRGAAENGVKESMAEKNPGTRSHEHEVEIRVPARIVWKALTDPKTLARWYVQKAEVEPRPGGRYWLSWGAEGVGEARIDVWEVNRRLRLVHLPFEGSPPLPDGGAIVEEFTLQDLGDSTLLRLVHSGIPDAPDWDAFFRGTDTGWDDYLEVLCDILEVGGEDEEEPSRPRAPKPTAPARRRKGGEGGDPGGRRFTTRRGSPDGFPGPRRV